MKFHDNVTEIGSITSKKTVSTKKCPPLKKSPKFVIKTVNEKLICPKPPLGMTSRRVPWKPIRTLNMDQTIWKYIVQISPLKQINFEELNKKFFKYEESIIRSTENITTKTKKNFTVVEPKKCQNAEICLKGLNLLKNYGLLVACINNLIITGESSLSCSVLDIILTLYPTKQEEDMLIKLKNGDIDIPKDSVVSDVCCLYDFQVDIFFMKFVDIFRFKQKLSAASIYLSYINEIHELRLILEKWQFSAENLKLSLNPNNGVLFFYSAFLLNILNYINFKNSKGTVACFALFPISEISDKLLSAHIFNDLRNLELNWDYVENVCRNYEENYPEEILNRLEELKKNSNSIKIEVVENEYPSDYFEFYSLFVEDSLKEIGDLIMILNNCLLIFHELCVKVGHINNDKKEAYALFNTLQKICLELFSKCKIESSPARENKQTNNNIETLKSPALCEKEVRRHSLPITTKTMEKEITIRKITLQETLRTAKLIINDKT